MKFEAREIDDAVLATIRKQAEVILAISELSQLSAKGDIGKELSEYEKRIAECNEQRQRYYESFFLHEIDREEYLKLKDECTLEIDRLNSQIAALKTEVRVRESDKKTLAFAKKIVGETIPYKEIVDALIERVLVFPDKRIEIEWKITDFSVL